VERRSPIEHNFHECSFGFRPERSAHQALEEVEKHLEEGFRAVLDADLKSSVDTMPHDNLLEAIKHRVMDGSVLKLIRMWLKGPMKRSTGT